MKIFDDFDAYLEHARTDMLPKMKGSAMSVTIVDGPVDIKLCVELGAAILLDKPIIAIILPGVKVPANLKRVASCILEGSPKDPGLQQKLQQAIERVLEHDRRAKS